jgi:flagellar biosynthesis protein FlhF
MEVRSYYATSVEAAIEMARRVLGPEAMLVHSRRTNPELSHLGRYEVVFAGEESTTTPPAPEPASAPVPPRRPRPDIDNAGLGPVDLVGKLDFAGVLRSAGVSPEMSREFFDGERKPARLSPARPSKDIMALVGPPGAGKTAVLMKLALDRGLLASRAVRILAFDPDRVGATNQLRHFAEILGISFAEFDTPAELCFALSDPADALTLIDTPGFSRSETAELNELALAFRAQTDFEIHLVLRADRKTADNLSAIARFGPFAPARLILTALDETGDHGDLQTLIGRAAIPVSFLSTGPRIEDLERASTSRLADIMRNGLPQSARAAA